MTRYFFILLDSPKARQIESSGLCCGVDKMEECLVTVLFFDDPLVYTYCYNLEKQGIELLWISDITNCTGVPKHSPISPLCHIVFSVITNFTFTGSPSIVEKG